MTKQQMVDAIENAKQIHQAQMQKIEDLIRGRDVENPTALNKMECECGQWFYSNKEQMIKILGHQLFERLDKTHEKWHTEYSRIYDLYIKQQKRKTSLFGKILGGGFSQLDLDKLKLYYKELLEVTEELLAGSEVAVRRVQALHENKFNFS